MDPRGDNCVNLRFSHKRSLKDLLRSTDDDSGYIEGKVFMTWPPRNKLHRLNLEVVEDSVLHRFEVEVPHESGIAFRPHEYISLALKGVKVDRRSASSAPYCFPIILRFPDGVTLKYLDGANAGKVVDSWQDPVANTDEWYNPANVPPVSDAVTNNLPQVYHGPVQLATHTRMTNPQDPSCPAKRVERPPFPPVTGTTPDQPVPAAQQPGTERSGRFSKRQRKKRKFRKDKEASTLPSHLANGTDEPHLDVVTNDHEQPKVPIQGSLISAPEIHQKLQSIGAASAPEDCRLGPSRADDDSNGMPAFRLKAGFYTKRGDIFTALSDLRNGLMINVIGVVTSANSEKRTSTNEWSRSFNLVDPSIVDSSRQGIKVNCFQKKHAKWLPQVQNNDIVILRRLKVTTFSDKLTATGFGGQLRWAIYDPLEHSVRHPNKGGVPEKEGIDGVPGYEYSPYWEPVEDGTELDYCRKIGEWWKDHLEIEGQGTFIDQRPVIRKRHLLISEASPDLPPRGFFNCTVEVLQKFDNFDRATSVYVTDYTANAFVHPVQASWCPPELRDRVLQCIMWDDARSTAKLMSPGEYWYLHNVRAKWNPYHCMEGTMQLAERVTQLEQTNLEVQPHLKALLARKDEFNSSLTSRSTSLHIFPEMLLQDVGGSTKILTCVIELLHSDLSSQDGCSIYVTDYTFNPDLPAAVSIADRVHNLEHRVLKIMLDTTQARISSDLVPGSMFIIHNLRLKHSNTSEGIHGYLGGEDTLIHPLHGLSGHHAQTLQKNKEKWKRNILLNGVTPMTNGPHEDAWLLERPSLPLDNVTLDEVRARPAPDVSRVLARVTDFFPFSLEEACILRCTKCESSPPPSFKRCPRCDDMMETYTKWFYCLYVQLRDAKGGEIIVSLSGKECTLLQDVDPVDFRCDRVAFQRFLGKLDPVLGNLRDVHDSWSRNEDKVIESPQMVFTIESWNVGDMKGYGLLNCVPV